MHTGREKREAKKRAERERRGEKGRREGVRGGKGREKKKLTPTPPAQNNSVLKMTAVKLGRRREEDRGRKGRREGGREGAAEFCVLCAFYEARRHWASNLSVWAQLIWS